VGGAVGGVHSCYPVVLVEVVNKNNSRMNSSLFNDVYQLEISYG